MATTTFSTLSTDAVTYIREELLDLAERLTVFFQFSEAVELPQHNSKTIQFSRYPFLPLPASPASEGVTGTDQALSVQTVTATIDQWILTVTLSDLSILTIKHPLVPVVNDLLGYAIAQLVDRECYKALNAGATVVFPGSVTSRSTLTSSNILDDTTLMKVAATLRSKGARAHDGTSYILIVDPFSEQDVINQTSTFLAAHQFKNVEALYNGEIGRWRGYRVVRSNIMPTLSLIANAAWSLTGNTGTGSAFTIGQIVFIKVTGVDTGIGFESQISNAQSATIAATGNNVVVTLPTTTGFTYNVYVSDTNNTSADANLHLSSTGNAAGSTVTITAFLATGANPPASPPTGVNVHTAFAIGKQAYSTVKLSGDNLRILVTPQTPTDSDPAAQRRKLSFKGSFKVVTLNADFFRKIEVASAFG